MVRRGQVLGLLQQVLDLLLPIPILPVAGLRHQTAILRVIGFLRPLRFRLGHRRISILISLVHDVVATIVGRAFIDRVVERRVVHHFGFQLVVPGDAMICGGLGVLE